MAKPAAAGVPILGAIFLLLGVYKLFAGENWVVWFILGVLFGGLGIFNLNKSKADRA